MVGTRENFSQPQGPEDLQNWSQPRQSFGIRLIAGHQPMSDAGERLVQKGSRRLGWIQAASQAAESGGIGQTIRVFERRGCLFPGAVLDQAPLQGLTTSQQAVVGVRERKRRQEGERLPATPAVSATDLDPVVMLIVSLLAAVSVADDRIAFTNGAMAQNNAGTPCSPIRFELVRRDGKWDKENRSSSGLCPGTDFPRSEPAAEPLPLKRKSQLEENNASPLRFLGCDSDYWPVNCRKLTVIPVVINNHNSSS